ncbi:MAG: serine hydrolase, partial [Candidatus Eremiobacteraeota bacterium]|nr:serine hydrolase [Candidatus Eremiobacteraeota bacterium]
PLTSDARLQRALDAALDAAKLRRDAAACVIDVDRARVAQWRSREDIYPASVIKIALMTSAFARFAAGTLGPIERVRIAHENVTPTAEPTPLMPRYEATVQQLVELMIERSDNIATNQLIDLLRREHVTVEMRALGLEQFFLGRKLSGADPLIEDPESSRRNSFTPHDAAQLLRLIALGRVPGASAQRALLERCMHNDRLTLGLRAGDRFAHKTGETSKVSHDAGILRTPAGGHYVIVLYTQPASLGDVTDVNPLMAAWMRALRAHL